MEKIMLAALLAIIKKVLPALPIAQAKSTVIL